MTYKCNKLTDKHGVPQPWSFCGQPAVAVWPTVTARFFLLSKESSFNYYDRFMCEYHHMLEAHDHNNKLFLTIDEYEILRVMAS
jgi:hypothetical protein